MICEAIDTVADIDVKQCLDCNKSLKLIDYHSNGYGGLRNICKYCFREKDKARALETKKRKKIIPPSKKCACCDRVKPSAEFSKNSTKKDGLWIYCKECDALRNRGWRKDNPDKHRARKSKHRARKNRAAPQWLSDSQWKEINDLYTKATKISLFTGIRHDVDHIHPLKGKNFSGLHVPWNLTIATASENRSKGNRPPKDELHLFWSDA
jgi:hypothetical protein